MNRLAPQMAAVMERLARLRAGQPARYGLPFDQARLALLAERRAWGDAGPDCEVTPEIIAGGHGRAIPVVRYAPAQTPAPVPAGAGSPLLVYLHGGGWCVGSPATHDSLVRRLCRGLAGEVWSVDYALAPEAPFPAGLLDCDRVLDQALARAGGRPVWVGGDSAGANLALALAMLRRDRAATMPAGLLLYYGVFTSDCTDASMAAFGDGRFGLSIAANQRYIDAYLGGGTGFGLQYVFACDQHASLQGLPPALLVAAELDILHDQSHVMASRLRAAGNRVQLVDVAGVIHGFLAYGSVLPQVTDVVKASAAFIG